MLVRDALARYVSSVSINHRGYTQERYRARVIARSALGALELSAVTRAQVVAYRNARTAEGKSPSTVRLELALLSGVYRTAAEEWEGFEGLANPAKAVKPPGARRGRTRRVTEPELVSLIRAACGRMRIMGAVVMVALETACRRGELGALTWADVDLQRRTLEIRETKNGEPRAVPLTRRATDVLAKLRTDQGGRAGSVFGMTSRAIGQRWRRLCRNAGVRGLRFHDLRHSALSALAERGLSALELQRIGGHKTLAMLSRYVHMTPEALLVRLDATE